MRITGKIVLIVFIAFIFFIGGIGYLVYKKIQEPNFSLPDKVEKPAFLDKLEGQSGNNITLEVTQEEFQSWLKSGLGKTISSPKIFIHIEEIEFSGNIKKFFVKSTIIGRAIPQVEDGKLKIKVTQVTMSGFKAPSAIPSSLEDITNTYLDQQINNQLTIESVELKEEIMIIIGSRK